jgi:hypothetical protein
MGYGTKLLCNNCGETFDYYQGSGISGEYRYHCNNCGKEKIIGYFEYKNLDDNCNCECGGEFLELTEPLCPKCYSKDLKETGCFLWD